MQGMSYAIPTKGASLITLGLYIIREHVERFVAFAEENPHLSFYVTRVGCGLAGYTDAQMAPLFWRCPPNVTLPDEWYEL